MRFYSVLIIFLSWCIMEVFLLNSGNNLWINAFVNISKALAEQNHLISVVVDDVDISSNFFVPTASAPHVIA